MVTAIRTGPTSFKICMLPSKDASRESAAHAHPTGPVSPRSNNYMELDGVDIFGDPVEEGREGCCTANDISQLDTHGQINWICKELATLKQRIKEQDQALAHLQRRDSRVDSLQPHSLSAFDDQSPDDSKTDEATKDAQALEALVDTVHTIANGMEEHFAGHLKEVLERKAVLKRAKEIEEGIEEVRRCVAEIAGVLGIGGAEKVGGQGRIRMAMAGGKRLPGEKRPCL